MKQQCLLVFLNSKAHTIIPKSPCVQERHGGRDMSCRWASCLKQWLYDLGLKMQQDLLKKMQLTNLKKDIQVELGKVYRRTALTTRLFSVKVSPDGANGTAIRNTRSRQTDITMMRDASGIEPHTLTNPPAPL